MKRRRRLIPLDRRVRAISRLTTKQLTALLARAATVARVVGAKFRLQPADEEDARQAAMVEALISLHSVHRRRRSSMASYLSTGQYLGALFVALRSCSPASATRNEFRVLPSHRIAEPEVLAAMPTDTTPEADLAAAQHAALVRRRLLDLAITDPDVLLVTEVEGLGAASGRGPQVSRRLKAMERLRGDAVLRELAG